MNDDEKIERKRARERAYYKKNRDRIRASDRARRAANKETIAAKVRVYLDVNADRIKKQRSLHYYANSDRLKLVNKLYHIKNKEKMRERKRKWRLANPEKVKESKRRLRITRSSDAKLLIRLRGRVSNAVRDQGVKKATKTKELIGCSVAAFRDYIEAKFVAGMTWDNIHLDHIIPCISFDLSDPAQLKRCFHFSNYQPLFVKDNLSKGDKLFNDPTYLPL